MIDTEQSTIGGHWKKRKKNGIIFQNKLHSMNFKFQWIRCVHRKTKPIQLIIAWKKLIGKPKVYCVLYLTFVCLTVVGRIPIDFDLFCLEQTDSGSIAGKIVFSLPHFKLLEIPSINEAIDSLSVEWFDTVMRYIYMYYRNHILSTSFNFKIKS